MIRPRSESDSPRSSGPTVITIPRDSNPGNENRGTGESRQFQEAPRYYKQRLRALGRRRPATGRTESPVLRAGNTEAGNAELQHSSVLPAGNT